MSFINVGFFLNGQRIYLQAKTDDMFVEVAYRYMQKIGLDKNADPRFFFNSLELKLNNLKTLAELNLHNMSAIDVVRNDYFSHPITIWMKSENKKFYIPTLLDNVFADIVRKYIVFTSQKEKKFHFFFNSTELKDLTKTIAEYSIADNSIIEVEECDHELCSKCCQCISEMQKEKNELNKRLNEEINKNIKLSIESEKLRNKLEKANSKIEKMEELENKIGENNNEVQSEYLITSINPGDKIIAVNFVSKGIQVIEHYNLICKKTDLFIKLEERLYKDFPKFKDYNTNFISNGKSVKRFKSIGDNNIKNNDVISIVINDD